MEAARSLVRTTKEMPAQMEPGPLTEHTFTTWQETFRLTVGGAGIAWVMDNPPVAPEDNGISAAQQKQLIFTVKEIINAKMSVDMKTIVGVIEGDISPRQRIDLIATIVTSTTAGRHQQLETPARTIRCGTDDNALLKCVKQHLTVRNLMVQAKYPNIPNEQTTARYIIEGILSHDKYGQVAQIIQVAGLPNSIKALKETVVNFVAAKDRQIQDTNRKGLNPPNKRTGERIPDDQLNKIIIFVGDRLSKASLTHNGGGGGAGGRHKAKKAKAKKVKKIQEQEEERETDEEEERVENETGKFLLYSGCHPTIINFKPSSAKTLTNPIPIEPANGKLFATHIATITFKQANNKRLRIPCLVAEDTDENLLSVADCVDQFGAVIMDSSSAYIVPKKRVVQLKKQLIPLATRKDGLYDVNVSIPSILNDNTNSARTSRTTTTVQQRLIVKLCNPATNQQIRVERDLPRRGRPRKKADEKKAELNPDPKVEAPVFTSPAQQLEVATEPQLSQTAANWHQIMNHAPAASLRGMDLDDTCVVPKHVAEKLPVKLSCSSCLEANISPHRTGHVYEREEALSSDSCGPLEWTGIGGERRFFTIIDVSTRYAAAIPIVNRSEIPELIEATFNNFIAEYGKAPKMFVSDGAREHMGQHVTATLNAANCKHSPTSQHSPEEKSIADRLNRTLQEAVRAELNTAELAQCFWPHAL